MALADYICCARCEQKIIYDGDDAGRDRLEQIWGDPDASEYTVPIICPDCVPKLIIEKQAEALNDCAKALRACGYEAAAKGTFLRAENHRYQAREVMDDTTRKI